MKKRTSETVITHVFVYSSLSVSLALLLGDLRLFTYLNLLLREIKIANAHECSWDVCVLIRHCFSTSAVIYLCISLFTVS